MSGRCSLRTSWVGHCIPRGWYVHLFVRYAVRRASISILLGLAAPFKTKTFKTFKMFPPTSAVLSHVFVHVRRATFPETFGDCHVAERFVIIRGVTWKLSHQSTETRVLVVLLSQHIWCFAVISISECTITYSLFFSQLLTPSVSTPRIACWRINRVLPLQHTALLQTVLFQLNFKMLLMPLTLFCVFLSWHCLF